MLPTFSTRRVATWLVGAVALALGSFGFTSLGHATTINTYNWTSDDCTGGCANATTTGGSVTVTDSGTGSLTFAILLPSSMQFVNTGLDASFAFELNGITTV